MVEVEIDGKKVEVAEGSMVMTAATAAGVYIPHFCYHKKLSIAANCRMCLVEVEKAPKPLPACATPVANGMKVFTKSEKAIKAQNGVMEFLLINHPLDCPICDQGGECQLQDLAVGYGASNSRYDQAKRVVVHKPMGPLISAEEMSRCIHCTRCVRFGQEVAGVMELGMAGRGEHSEIMSFLGRSVESELSGNMIDVCPVGALTSKPFRYSARTWELARRRSVAAHDSLGSNIVVQVKGDRVMRVLPYENEDLNECWLSDRDRFSYEGLNAPDRLTEPMIKEDGEWIKVDWQTALDYAAQSLANIKLDQGAAQVGFLASPNSTLEELGLMAQLARAYGSESVDSRLRQTDTQADARRAGIPYLGMKVAELAQLDRLLLVGATLRADHPLLAARIRQATKRQLKLHSVHGFKQDLLMNVKTQWTLAPSLWVAALAEIAQALRIVKAGGDLASAGLSETAVSIAQSLACGERVAVLLGNAAQYHPQFTQLQEMAQAICEMAGDAENRRARFGLIGDAANAVGAYVAGAVPKAPQAHSAARMFTDSAPAMRGFVLVNVEPSMDIANSAAAMKVLSEAKSVIALTAYQSPDLLEVADCLLPVTPFTETAGTFVNTEGRAQSFKAIVKPLGQARPGWKVLRVLGNLLHLSGFDFYTAEQVRQHFVADEFVSGLNNQLQQLDIERLLQQAPKLQAVSTPECMALVPQYRTDAVVRRAASLQQTRSARSAALAMPGQLIQSLKLTEGAPAWIGQGLNRVRVVVERDDSLAENTVRVDAARSETAALGAVFGPLTIEPISAARAA